MLFNKITEGHVIQVFNEAGECISQRFVACDPVEYESENHRSIMPEDMPLGGQEYQSFDMVQPPNEATRILQDWYKSPLAW